MVINFILYIWKSVNNNFWKLLWKKELLIRVDLEFRCYSFVALQFDVTGAFVIVDGTIASSDIFIVVTLVIDFTANAAVVIL